MNPYQPPAAPAAPVLQVEAKELRQPDATKGKRFLNFTIDRLVSTFVLGLALGAFVPGAAEWAMTLSRLEDVLLGYTLATLYYILMEGTCGFTLGKLVSGTRVFNADGKKKASFGQIIGRSLCRLIPFEPFSFFGSGPGGWHDTISNTRVLDMRAKPLPPKRPPPPRGALPVQRPVPPRGPRPAPVSRPPQQVVPPPPVPPPPPPVPPDES